MPYADYVKTAQCLDYRRLGKQRVEAYQLINILTGKSKSKAWSHHPACLMWKGYEDALKMYFNVIVYEWVSRGYKNNMSYYNDYDAKSLKLPFWFGDDKFHASHRSNLLRKDKSYYERFGWSEPDDLPYVWPTGRINK